MGQSEYKANTLKDISTVTKRDFIFQGIIGKGGFGKVWKVSVPKLNNAPFAMKELSKLKIFDKNSVGNILQEREILSKLHNAFIVNMCAAFQDNEHLYLLMDYLEGGDLRYHLYKQKRFNEQQTKFFIACVIEALCYIHANHIIHRDIKPENLVMDRNGYVRLTDFGVAKSSLVTLLEERSGTLGYMAPEILNGYYHSYPSDLFSLGVVCFELVFGYRPFHAKAIKDFIEQINSKPINVSPFQLPNGYGANNDHICSFINGLLVPSSQNRLGKRDVSELKVHPWFSNFNWDKLKDKALISPFTLSSLENFDKNLCEYRELIGNATKERYEAYLKDEDYKNAFEDYIFVYKESPTKTVRSTSRITNQIEEKQMLFKSPIHSTIFNITGLQHRSSRASSIGCKLPLLTTHLKFSNRQTPTLLAKNASKATARLQAHSKLVKCLSFRSPSFPNRNNSQTSLLKSFITRVSRYKKSITIYNVANLPKRVSRSLI